MLTDPDPHAVARERLSALMDGELDAAAAAQACAQWTESDRSRSAWHAYHLIGDVLRSDDLACDPAREAGFLQAFRARLAAEPVVLAPQPIEWAGRGAGAPAGAGGANGASGRRWSWVVPSAVAASFVAVAGGLALTRGPTVPQASPELAQIRAAAVPAVATAGLVSEPQVYIANGQLIRDARLDSYLAAHKQFAGSTVLGVPSVFLRDATADVAADR